jgi:hypothetical protein
MRNVLEQRGIQFVAVRGSVQERLAQVRQALDAARVHSTQWLSPDAS